jgi:hypothetical protein
VLLEEPVVVPREVNPLSLALYFTPRAGRRFELSWRVIVEDAKRRGEDRVFHIDAFTGALLSVAPNAFDSHFDPIVPYRRGDTNADGRIDLSDPVYALSFLFQGGAAPPAPFPACGLALRRLGCECYPPCSE